MKRIRTYTNALEEFGFNLTGVISAYVSSNDKTTLIAVSLSGMDNSLGKSL